LASAKLEIARQTKTQEQMQSSAERQLSEAQRVNRQIQTLYDVLKTKNTADESKRLADESKRIADESKRIADESKRIEDKNALSSARSAMAQLENIVVTTREQLASAKLEIALKEANVAKTQERLQSTEKQLVLLNQVVLSDSSRVKRLESESADFKDKSTSCETKRSQESETWQKQFVALTQQIEALQREAATRNQEILQYQSVNNQASFQLSEQQQQILALTSQLDKQNLQLSKMDMENKRLVEGQLVQLSTENTRLKEDVRLLKSTLEVISTSKNENALDLQRDNVNLVAAQKLNLSTIEGYKTNITELVRENARLQPLADEASGCLTRLNQQKVLIDGCNSTLISTNQRLLVKEQQLEYNLSLVKTQTQNLVLKEQQLVEFAGKLDEHSRNVVSKERQLLECASKLEDEKRTVGQLIKQNELLTKTSKTSLTSECDELRQLVTTEAKLPLSVSQSELKSPIVVENNKLELYQTARYYRQQVLHQDSDLKSQLGLDLENVPLGTADPKLLGKAKYWYDRYLRGHANLYLTAKTLRNEAYSYLNQLDVAWIFLSPIQINAKALETSVQSLQDVLQEQKKSEPTLADGKRTKKEEGAASVVLPLADAEIARIQTNLALLIKTMISESPTTTTTLDKCGFSSEGANAYHSKNKFALKKCVSGALQPIALELKSYYDNSWAKTTETINEKISKLRLLVNKLETLLKQIPKQLTEATITITKKDTLYRPIPKTGGFTPFSRFPPTTTKLPPIYRRFNVRLSR